MSTPSKHTLQEGYNRLKKAFDKILKPKKQSIPQIALQPCRNQPNGPKVRKDSLGAGR